MIVLLGVLRHSVSVHPKNEFPDCHKRIEQTRVIAAFFNLGKVRGLCCETIGCCRSAVDGWAEEVDAVGWTDDMHLVYFLIGRWQCRWTIRGLSRDTSGFSCMLTARRSNDMVGASKRTNQSAPKRLTLQPTIHRGMGRISFSFTSPSPCYPTRLSTSCCGGVPMGFKA